MERRAVKTLLATMTTVGDFVAAGSGGVSTNRHRCRGYVVLAGVAINKTPSHLPQNIAGASPTGLRLQQNLHAEQGGDVA